MAIKKQYLKSKPICKVTFEVIAKESKTVSVVGDFNEWNSSASPLKKLKNGKFKAVFPLTSGNTYEFKYIVDGKFLNEENADAFAWNNYANSENSVLEL
ncbi:isoamylase early set domain-containing protein [Flavicella sp.]|uniref:isoamylase early set domain-containing protein n=1 Tax=Flavicella sp. TaxID=2957742 RepID=UPI00301A3216